MGFEQIVLIVHVLAAISIIALILLQQGKGADAGASFGSGASQTVFGSGGSGNFLTKSTAALATLFFVTSFALAIIAKDKASVDVNSALPSADAIEAQQQTAGELPLADDMPATAELPAADDLPAADIPGASADIPAAPAAESANDDLPQ